VILVLTLGVVLLATRCVVQGRVLTVRETRLALVSLREEPGLLAQRTSARESRA
jgi:hypothetical protein